MGGNMLKIILISVSAVLAQEVQLSGTVVNQAGVPLQGLEISLLNNQISDTTDAEGKFLLRKSATSVARNSRDLQQRPAFSGDRLTVPPGSPVGEVCLKLFDLNGALIQAVDGIRPGQAVPVSGLVASSKMRLMVLAYGNQTFRFTVMKVNNRIICREINGSARGLSGLSEKTGSVSGDSLTVRRKQQVEFAIWRGSLAGSVAIRLDLVPYEIVDLAVAENGRYPDEVGKDLTVYPNAISNYLMKTGTGVHDYEAWCSEFVAWAYKAAGYPLTGGTQQGGWMLQGSTELRSWFQQKAQFFDENSAEWDTFQPAPGDYIRYDNPSGGHSGIVRYSSKDTLYTVEGNVNNTVMLRKIVRWRTYQSGTTSIDGIGRRSGVMKSVLEDSGI